MAKRYHVGTYRPITCSNEECENFDKIIPIDQKYVPHASIGECWRTFCSCGDGAGWRLDSTEWDDNIQLDEIIITIKMQILPDTSHICVGDGVATPYWTHDCDQCTWLGSRIFEDCVRYDFYWCKSSVSSFGTGIIRAGNEPDDNDSYMFWTMDRWDGLDLSDACVVLNNLVMTHLAE